MKLRQFSPEIPRRAPTRLALLLCATLSAPVVASCAAPAPNENRALSFPLPEQTLHITDGATLAAALAGPQQRRALVLVNDAARFETALQALPENARWAQLQNALQSAGLTFFMLDETLCAVQGVAYALEENTDADPQCDRARTDWDDLAAALEKSDAATQERMFSQTGVTYAADLHDCPPLLARVIENVGDWKSYLKAGQNSRVRINFNPALRMSFPDPPAKLSDGYWYWSASTLGGDLQFPAALQLPPSSFAFEKSVLKAPLDLVAKEDLQHQLENATDWKMTGDKKVKWPAFWTRGAEISTVTLLRCLQISTLAQPQIDAEKKSVALLPPQKMAKLRGDKWMSPADARQFAHWFDIAAAHWKNRFGPLPHAALLLPFGALPPAWQDALIKSPSNAESDAWQENRNLDTNALTAKWRQAYQNSDALLLPGLALALSIEIEDATIERGWRDVMGTEKVYLPVCY